MASFLERSKGGVIFKMKDDPRITKVGRFLRRTSMDGLRNVFIGDMSLVGPRLPVPSEVDNLFHTGGGMA